MHFPRLLTIGTILCLTLAACGAKKTITYNATFDTTDLAQSTALVQSVEKVMVRKLSAMGMEKPRVVSIPSGKKGATVTFTIADDSDREIVEQMAAERLTFDMRIEKKKQTDPKTFDPDNWVKTSLTGSSIIWVQAIGDRSTGKISIDLELNARGKSLMTDIMQKNKGKALGIFVRDLLVSKLIIENVEPSNHFRISGVPSQKIAEIFADDVNVGLRAVLTPVTQ